MKLTRPMLVALDAWAAIERKQRGLTYARVAHPLATLALARAGLIDIGPGGQKRCDVALTPTGELVLAAYRLGRAR